MAQIFHRSVNTLARLSIFGAGFGVLGLLTLAYLEMKSPYQTKVDVVVEQPIPFSHEHHVGELGVDCRYCHTTVEKNGYAGMPPTHTCMSCHSQIWNDSPMLAPVRESLANDEPIRWQKTHDLPDFVYFNHGIHVQKGVGCTSCHGRVDKMPLMFKAAPLTMEWCLDCHRHPEEHVRPASEIFSMTYALPKDEQVAKGKELVKANHIHSPYYLTNCSVCHR